MSALRTTGGKLLPPGCPLVSRCPFNVEQCRLTFPPAESVTRRHRVHCFRHAAVAARERATDTFEAFQETAQRILSVPAAQIEAV